ncbi:hypothetical protein GCK32_000465 [Trichostrongylus colubriformis]|uniref:Uncharacterized protein n=1 Tax=Trichostrongylus colubriformis TaxID=6319 RepID=A0AAN8IDC3_TRICO
MELKITSAKLSMELKSTTIRVHDITGEERNRRTPVMGIKAEARRLSQVKNRQLRRNQSALSRRSIHRGRRGWFRVKPRPLPRNLTDAHESQRQHRPGVEWARTVINRLSFNKLFKK